MFLKRLFYFYFGEHFVKRSRTISAILVEGHYGDHPGESISNSDQLLRRRCRLKKKFTIKHDGLRLREKLEQLDSDIGPRIMPCSEKGISVW